MKKKNSKTNEYGIFNKDGYHCLIICESKEEAERLVGDRKDLEVREIL